MGSMLSLDLRSLLSSALAVAMVLTPWSALAGEPGDASLARRCDKGQAAACAALAERWERAAEDACAAGAAEACLGLAEAQLQGLGVGDAERAWWSYEAACFQGVDEACRRVAVIRALRAEPSRPLSPLTVLMEPGGFRIQGVTASLLSSLERDGDDIVIACTRDRGCSSSAHFDWDALRAALVQIARADPSRRQVVLRARGVDYGTLLEAARRVAGEGDAEPLFPQVIIPEVAP